MRKVFWVLTTVLTLFAFAILFSPYTRHEAQSKRAIRTSIVIDASPEAVFAYLGNSANAAKWSVYVHHITTLNGAAVEDGMPGSIRRCFKQANEQGIVWDEMITIAVPGQKRQLTIYNMTGFPINADHLLTEQLYERLPGNTTRLTFSLFYGNEPGPGQTIKTYFAAYVVDNIFKKNLKNIKADIERM